MDMIRQRISLQICHTPKPELKNAWFFWMGYIQAKLENGDITIAEHSLLSSYVGMMTRSWHDRQNSSSL